MSYSQGPVQDQRREIAAVIQRCYKRYKQVGAAEHNESRNPFSERNWSVPAYWSGRRIDYCGTPELAT